MPRVPNKDKVFTFERGVKIDFVFGEPVALVSEYSFARECFERNRLPSNCSDSTPMKSTLLLIRRVCCKAPRHGFPFGEDLVTLIDAHGPLERFQEVRA